LLFTLPGSHFSVRVHVRFNVRGSRFEVRGSRFEVRAYSRADVEGITTPEHEHEHEPEHERRTEKREV